MSPGSEVDSHAAGSASISPCVNAPTSNAVFTSTTTRNGGSTDGRGSHVDSNTGLAAFSATNITPTAPSAIPTSDRSLTDANASRIAALVQTFFRVIHPNPECSFLQRAVFMNHKQSKQLDLGLLRAVCSMASLLHPDLRVDGARWADEAEREALLSLTRPSIVCVQVLQLLVVYRLATGDSRRVVSLFALCTRMAYLLRLNYEDSSLPSLAQESRRRLMWAIFITDTFMSGGIEDLTLCRAASIHLWLPSDEHAFELDQTSSKHVLHAEGTTETGAPSIFGSLLKVIDIRDRILRYTKSIARADLPAAQLQRDIQHFESELHRQQQHWPDSAVFNTKNISLRACSPSLPKFILMHVLWHQCHCDLHRFLTPGFRESSSSQVLRRMPQAFVQHCMSQCTTHAFAVADIFGHILDLELENPLTAPNLALCAYQCSTIISRSVYMEEAAPSVETKPSVSKCLRMVEMLYPYNPVLSPIRRDIQKLLEEGAPPVSYSRQQSPQQTSQPANVEAPPTLQTPVRHKFSRYNVVDAASVNDNGEALFFRDAGTSDPRISANDVAASLLETRSRPAMDSQLPLPSPYIGNVPQLTPGPDFNNSSWSQMDDSWLMSVLQGTGSDFLHNGLNSFMDPVPGWGT